jgi:hypothetical protein
MRALGDGRFSRAPGTDTDRPGAAHELTLKSHDRETLTYNQGEGGVSGERGSTLEPGWGDAVLPPNHLPLREQHGRAGEKCALP